jgi:hypothetical protein
MACEELTQKQIQLKSLMSVPVNQVVTLFLKDKTKPVHKYKKSLQQKAVSRPTTILVATNRNSSTELSKLEDPILISNYSMEGSSIELHPYVSTSVLMTDRLFQESK